MTKQICMSLYNCISMKTTLIYFNTESRPVAKRVLHNLVKCHPLYRVRFFQTNNIVNVLLSIQQQNEYYVHTPFYIHSRLKHYSVKPSTCCIILFIDSKYKYCVLPPTIGHMNTAGLKVKFFKDINFTGD